jgi:predicted acylesterase/phospholipase RssA
MRVGWRSAAALLAVGVIAVTGARLYLGPMRTLEPMGVCLKGDINLDDPKPFVAADYGGLVVGIATSGGGSRAAYLTAAVLREIRRKGAHMLLGDDSKARSLLDQVSAVSSVSGSSLAAGYFALNADTLKSADADEPAWSDFLEKMAIEYRTREWYHMAALDPRLWGRLLFTDYNRGVLARDDYNSLLFQDATLDRLPEKPALYLNAFDVANHVRFVFSRHYIDTAHFQPKDWWGVLVAPQTLLSENDLAFTRIEPASIGLADAVYASSAFPIAYPNLPLKHCGSKILFQGGEIFLADGGLADNSGLLTLLSQVRAGFDEEAKGTRVVAIAIDSSVDRLDTNGTKFQQMGVEEHYAWENTVVGHATEAIYGAIALLQDLGWTFVESTGVITDQLSANWPLELPKRSGQCAPPDKVSWHNLFENGALALRPLIIRLGLRDVIDPDFASEFGPDLKDTPELAELLKANGIEDGIGALSKHIGKRLQSVPTDFTLTPSDRRLLDLTDYLLVHGKLAADVRRWNSIDREAAASPAPTTSCKG